MIQNATRLLVGIYFMINRDNAHMQMSWRVSEDKNDVDHVLCPLQWVTFSTPRPSSKQPQEGMSFWQTSAKVH